MALLPWQAGGDVIDLFCKVKEKYHHPRLEQANVAIAFTDTKPFVRGRFNWGKVQKFSPLARLWHPDSHKYDFVVILCGDAWHDVLNMSQREALADLHLTRCDVEFEPETVTDPVTGKKNVVKDEFGRVQMSGEIKCDDDGNPKWKVQPLDLHIFTENVTRYGIWCEDLLDFKHALQEATKKKEAIAEEVAKAAEKLKQHKVDPDLIVHTSNPEFEKMKNDPTMEALRDRTVKVDMDKLLNMGDG